MITIILTILQVAIKRDIEFCNGNNNNILDIFMYGMDILGIHNILIHMLGIVIGLIGIMRITTIKDKTIINIIIGIDRK